MITVLDTCRESWRMRVRGLHTYPTLSMAVTEFEQMAANSGLLSINGDGRGCLRAVQRHAIMVLSRCVCATTCLTRSCAYASDVPRIVASKGLV